MPSRKLPIAQIEVLVEEVRHNPILYDPKCAEHKDAQKIHNTWSSIYNVMARKFGNCVEEAHDGRYYV